MKKILVFVTSLDGKITRWGESPVSKWTSREDHVYFKKLWDDSAIKVLGSSTYTAAPMEPTPKNHIVVMTRTPENYKEFEVLGQLEFTYQSPAQIVEHYEKKGLHQMLIVGCAHIATYFLKANLIDEIWLTIEPKLFGIGGNFVINEKLEIDLQLISVEKVNQQGTLITKYAVIK